MAAFIAPLLFGSVAVGDAPIGDADRRFSPAAGDAEGNLSPPSRPLSRPSKSAKRKPRTAAGSFWKTISVLAVLVIVIVVGAKLLRKHAPNLGGGIPADALEVLGKRTIDRGQNVYLVRLGSRILIVGSSAGGLQTLGEITDPVEIDYIAGLCKPKDQPSTIAQGFLALFNRQQAVQPQAETNGPERFSNGDEIPAPVHDLDSYAEPERTHVQA